MLHLAGYLERVFFFVLNYLIINHSVLIGYRYNLEIKYNKHQHKSYLDSKNGKAAEAAEEGEGEARRGFEVDGV